MTTNNRPAVSSGRTTRDWVGCYAFDILTVSSSDQVAGNKFTKGKAAVLWSARPLEASGNELDAMIDEALVDCYTDSEKLTAMMTAIQVHLALPFTTMVLGLTVSVVAVDLNEVGDIVALCTSNGRQRIRLLDLPLPDPPPPGAQWVAALRRFARNH